MIIDFDQKGQKEIHYNQNIKWNAMEYLTSFVYYKQQQKLKPKKSMSRMYDNKKSLTEKVLNFEISRLNKMKKTACQPPDHDYPLRDRYRQWRLPGLITSLQSIETITSVKWIGHEQDSHIYSLLYCLLKGCTATSRQSGKKSAESKDYLRVKYNMYRLASQFLRINQQKKIVELMSSAEYSKDLSKFMNENSAIENLFSNIVHLSLRHLQIDEHHIESLVEFVSLYFPFSFFKIMLTSGVTEEKIGVFTVSCFKAYIIQCHDCFFVVEVEMGQNTKIMTPRIKRTKTEVFHTKIMEQLSDEEKEYDDIEEDEEQSLESHSSNRNSTPKFMLRSTTENTDKNHLLIEKCLTTFHPNSLEKKSSPKRGKEGKILANMFVGRIQCLIDKLRDKSYGKMNPQNYLSPPKSLRRKNKQKKSPKSPKRNALSKKMICQNNVTKSRRQEIFRQHPHLNSVTTSVSLQKKVIFTYL